MDLNEYNKVKNLNYLEYCDYLQNEYGILLIINGKSITLIK